VVDVSGPVRKKGEKTFPGSAKSILESPPSSAYPPPHGGGNKTSSMENKRKNPPPGGQENLKFWKKKFW